MTTPPFMPLWVADFVGDTMDLEAKEIGAYMLLLMSMWTRDGSLPHDMKKLQRVARVGRDWPKIWASLERYFQVEDGRITNKRLTEELHKVATKRAVNSHSGARGGRAKALKDKERRLANATVSLCQPEPEPERVKKEPKGSQKRGSRLPENWGLPREWGDWALTEGWSEPAVRAEAEKFRDYWTAATGAKAAKLDWFATWRNWMRNSRSPKLVPGENDGRSSRPSKLALIKAGIADGRFGTP